MRNRKVPSITPSFTRCCSFSSNSSAGCCAFSEHTTLTLNLPRTFSVRFVTPARAGFYRRPWAHAVRRCRRCSPKQIPAAACTYAQCMHVEETYQASVAVLAITVIRPAMSCNLPRGHHPLAPFIAPYARVLVAVRAIRPQPSRVETELGRRVLPGGVGKQEGREGGRGRVGRGRGQRGVATSDSCGMHRGGESPGRAPTQPAFRSSVGASSFRACGKAARGV